MKASAEATMGEGKSEIRKEIGTGERGVSDGRAVASRKAQVAYVAWRR